MRQSQPFIQTRESLCYKVAAYVTMFYLFDIRVSKIKMTKDINIFFDDNYNNTYFESLTFNESSFQYAESGEMARVNIIFYAERLRTYLMLSMAQVISDFKHRNKRLPCRFLFKSDKEEKYQSEIIHSIEKQIFTANSLVGCDFFTGEAIEWEWDVHDLLHKNGSVWLSIKKLAELLISEASINEEFVVNKYQIESVLKKHLKEPGSLCYSREFYQTLNLR